MSPDWNYTTAVFQIHQTCSDRSYQTSVKLVLSLCAVLNAVLLVRIFRTTGNNNSSFQIIFLTLQLSIMVAVLFYCLELVFLLHCPRVAAGTVGSVVIQVLRTLTEPPRQIINWMITVLALWRLVAVVSPMRARALLTNKLAGTLVAAVSVTSCLWSVFTFFYHVRERSYYSFYDRQLGKCYVLPNFLETDPVERRNFLVYSAIVTALPLILSIALKVRLVLLLLCQERRQGELQEGQSSSTDLAQCAKMICSFLLSVVIHAVGLCGPDLLALAVFACTDHCPAINEHMCFLYFHFPALVYFGFVAVIVYSLLSGRVRDNVVQGAKAVARTCTSATGRLKDRASVGSSRKYIFVRHNTQEGNPASV